jgi:hypothetical protein
MELNQDVLSVIYHWLGEGRFPLVPPFCPNPALAPDGFYMGKENHALIRAQWVATRRALQSMCTMAAVCRAWSAALDQHWPAIYAAASKFFPFIMHPIRDRNSRGLVSRPASTLNPWCRLAVKFVCRSGRQFARQQIHLKKPIRKGREFKPKPSTLYVVRDKVTQARRITKGKHIINPASVELEGTLVEKKVGGHNFWRTATIEQVDAAVLRRAQILRDTRAMANALRRAQRGK